MKVYGPYTRKDGRQHVILYENGKRQTVSYPKYLMEVHLGRKLDPDLETVDHIDRDFTNNAISNLRIIDRPTHTSEDNIRVELITFICAWCDEPGQQKPRNLEHNKNRGRAGPFCGKSCAGKYSNAVKSGKIQPYQRNDVQSNITQRTYYSINKS